MIATEVSKKRYLGNDATTIFPYTFRIDAAADLTVIIADAVDTQTILVLDVDYTISGVGVETGGNVTYPIVGAPLPLGSSITIYRHLDVLQSTNFINQGDFYAETHESTFDTVVMLIQQMQEQLDRTFKVTSTSGDNGDDVYAEILEAEINALASEVAAAASEAAAAASEAAAASSAAEAAAPISFLQGAIEETVDLNITEAGGTVYAQIQAEGGGDLKIYFSTGAYIFDSTPAALVALTAGTDTVPKLNYVYILESTKALTANITGWPAAEHAPIGTVLVQTAASVATDGAYKIHAWIDHLTDSNEQGHLSHLNRWVREQHATWISGVTPTLTVTVIGGSDTVIFTSTVGEIMQLHPHAFPAFTGTPDIYVINDNAIPYNKITDINQLTAYSDGVAISNNERFSIVIMGIVNEDTGDCKLMLSLPSGGYNTDGKALADLDGKANHTIPTDFRGTAFLIAKYTLKYLTADSGTFSKVATGDVDLRGFLPDIIARGGTGGGISETIIDAKGDLIVGTADDTPAQLTVGTNGQVLKANSGEASGIKWEEGGIPETIIDAKGDLIVGTADDIVTRLAVGTNGYIPIADSAETTGIKWTQGRLLISDTSFPASPSAGDLFYHTTHDILFQYENSVWNPLFNYGSTLALYVDSGSGSDAIGKGFGSGANATATIQYCWDYCVPKYFVGAITINITAATYTEELVLAGKTKGSPPATITLLGTLSNQTSGTASAGSTTTLTDAGAGWSINEFQHDLLRLTGGTGDGQFAWVVTNTGSIATISGRWNTNPNATTTYSIDQLGTIINGGAGNVSITVNDMSGLILKYLKATTCSTFIDVYRSEITLIGVKGLNAGVTGSAVSLTNGTYLREESTAIAAVNIGGTGMTLNFLSYTGSNITRCYLWSCGGYGLTLIRGSVGYFTRCYTYSNGGRGFNINGSQLYMSGADNYFNNETTGIYATDMSLVTNASLQTYNACTTDYNPVGEGNNNSYVY